MAGEKVSSVVDATEAKKGEDGGRQRSTIAFPYNDLDSVVALAKAIHNHVGTGQCGDDQLAAWTDQSAKSSGYRTQLSAARMFGIIESPSGQHRLTSLGRQIVDPSRAREARARAFLNVPLYSAVYEKFRGGVLPPPAALEREMENLGVAPKMKDRARRVFERSAQQGGFCEQGTNRLVMPGIAPMDGVQSEDRGSDEDSRGGGSGGSGSGDDAGRHPFIQGLLAELPPPKTVWSQKDRQKWLETAANIFALIYKSNERKEDSPDPDPLS